MLSRVRRRALRGLNVEALAVWRLRVRGHFVHGGRLRLAVRHRRTGEVVAVAHGHQIGRRAVNADVSGLALDLVLDAGNVEDAAGHVPTDVPAATRLHDCHGDRHAVGGPALAFEPVALLHLAARWARELGDGHPARLEFPGDLTLQ